MDKWSRLSDKIQQIRGSVEGTIGVAVTDLSTGEELQLDGDELFPLASVLKIPVLVEMYRQVGRGELDLDTRYTLTEDIKSHGSGVLKEIRPGAALTLWDYALLMIIISDNTATDTVCSIVGIDKVDPTMRALGLERTSVRVDCFHLLCELTGLDTNQPREKVLEESMKRFRSVSEEDLIAQIRRGDLGKNVSTPVEMNKLLAKLLEPGGARAMNGEVLLGPQEQAGAIDILQRQQLRQRIPYLLPRGTVVAHKTGTVPGTFNDCGIVYGPDQKPAYIISLLSKGVTDLLEGPMILAKISKAVYDELIG